MHDESADGSEFFKCDFCRRPWAEDRPMVEGHRGSLICGQCLTVAFADVVLHSGGATLPAGTTCKLCLEERKEPCWQSPMHETEWACLRCIKQSAGVLTKDKESGWTRPVP
jgi:hypothetical protein